MPLLLDAYNILHVVGVLPPDLAGIDLDELADLVADSRFRGDEAILVCDGVPKRHAVTHPSVHVRFAGAGRTADETIVRLVRRSSAPKRITVVTSDREIVQAVRRRRAGVIPSDRFLAMLAEDHTRPGSPSRSSSTSAMHPSDRRQVDAWLRLFRVDPELEALPPSGSPATESPSTTPPAPEGDRSTASRTSSRTGPPPRNAESPARRGRSVLEAPTLADIDPASLDELDTARLLDSTIEPAGEATDTGESGDNASSDRSSS